MLEILMLLVKIEYVFFSCFMFKMVLMMWCVSYMVLVDFFQMVVEEIYLCMF